MSEICRKDSLTRNMARMIKMFPKEYAFYPKAWCLPAEYEICCPIELLILIGLFVVTLILLNIAPRKSLKHIFPNQMSAAKVEVFL